MPSISREDYRDLHEDPAADDAIETVECATCGERLNAEDAVTIDNLKFHEDCARTFAWRCEWCGEWSQDFEDLTVLGNGENMHKKCFEEHRELEDQHDKPDGR